MIRFAYCILASLTFLSKFSIVRGATELIVTQTGGPTECNEHDKATKGKWLSMFYTGSIDESSETGEKGFVFESNFGHNTFEFQIGMNTVIDGWDEGLLDKCKGAELTLIIPPYMAFSDNGAHDVIPGGATLRFEVEIVRVSHIQKPSKPVNKEGKEDYNLFAYIDFNQDGMLDEDELIEYFHGIGVTDGIPPTFMENEDTDKDGKISFDEFRGPKGMTSPDYELEL